MFEITRQLLEWLNRRFHATRLLSWPEAKGLRIAVLDAGGDADQAAQCFDALETFFPESDVTFFPGSPLAPIPPPGDYPALKSIRVELPGAEADAPDLAILLHPWPAAELARDNIVHRQFAKLRARWKWILFKNQELWEGRLIARLSRRLLHVPRRMLLATADRDDRAILNREVAPYLPVASRWQGPSPCGHPRAKTVFKTPRHEKFCPDCGAGFTPPEHAPSAPELAKIYGPGYAFYFKFTGVRGLMHYIENCIAAVGGYLDALGLDDAAVPPEHRRVLDFGCGNGRYSLLWTRRGWRYLGVDPSADNIAYARRFFGNGGDSPAFVQGGLDAPAIHKSSPFGLIFLSHVLEHVPDPLDLLVALRRLAAPGGWLYVEVPDALRFTWNPVHRGYLSLEHLWDFPPAYLAALAREAGWNDVRLHTPGDPNCPWIALLARNQK